MERKILVSLVSDQTIPNVELIKEFDGISKYLFIYTPQKINQLNWILNATGLTEDIIDKIEVNAFDIADIEKKLSDFQFVEAEYFVNITGGTKLMILVIQEFFKNIGAKIFYITGQNKEYIKVFPSIGKRKNTLQSSLTLKEYLTSYGFDYKNNPPYKDEAQAKRIFDYFIEVETRELSNLIEPIRKRRGKNFPVNIQSIIGFLAEVDYQYADQTLLKNDTRYLSGDWLEEYVYYQIKKDLKLSDSEIATGIQIKKENTPNEIDVIFVYDHKLYIIECKTSIIDRRRITLNRNGIEVEEEKDFKLLPEILNKSDALRNKFGLFANTSIVTLETIRDNDNNPLPGYETHFERAKYWRIKIISANELKYKLPIVEQLKIGK
jgi:hypothetical protein